MKKCRNCQLEKPITEFYVHYKMKDGYLNKCIDCVKNRVKKHREINIEKIKQYDRKRGRDPKRMERVKLFSRKVREEGREYGIRWNERNPEKKAAHSLVRRAILKGRLIKGYCEFCKLKKVEAHHDDYMKPLEVRWLCRKHHAEIHRKYKD